MRPDDRRSTATYSLLGPRTTPPSEYEIVTSQLLPYVARGFEVNVPLGDWYARYQTNSALRCQRWEAFCDPRETTYTSYTRLQQRQEAEVAVILETIEAEARDAELAHAQVARLASALSVLRFPLHGFHMVASYVGQMAPSGRIAIAALLQSADELRRIERFAYRLALLKRRDPKLGDDGRSTWQLDPAWQPLRALLEQLLVTYDWGEAFVALALCLKPMVDELITTQWARQLDRDGDSQLAAILRSLGADCLWHRAWSSTLVRTVLVDTPGSRVAIEGWLERWTKPTIAAVRAIAPLVVSTPEPVIEAIDVARMAMHTEAGLRGGVA